MNFDAHLFFQALALAIFLEGLFYTLMSGHIHELARLIASKEPAFFRKAGFAAMAFGLLALWLSRH